MTVQRNSHAVMRHNVDLGGYYYNGEKKAAEQEQRDYHVQKYSRTQH